MRRDFNLLAAVCLAGALVAQPALAQQQGEAAFAPGPEEESLGPTSDALNELLAQARTGQGDRHLPFLLLRLKRALSTQDLIAFLDLVDPTYFKEQIAFLAGENRSPGEVMGQFTCEFLQICDVSKVYTLKDVVSAKVMSARTAGSFVVIQLEMQMWDGVQVPAEILYNPASYRFEAGRG